MSLLKKILLGMLIVFVAIQLIRPAKNISKQSLPTDIVLLHNVPGNVQALLKKACYDCHSDNTRYPWYVNIEPVGWMLAYHVKNGKENLNFSEFGNYSERKQTNKLRAVVTSIKEGSMPLSSYMLIHTDARLSSEDKKLLTGWASKIKDSIALKN
jgi:hypothetical protein